MAIHFPPQVILARSTFGPKLYRYTVVFFLALPVFTVAGTAPQSQTKHNASTRNAPPILENLLATRLADPFLISDKTGLLVLTGTAPNLNVPILTAATLQRLHSSTPKDALNAPPSWGLKPMGAEIAAFPNHFALYFVSKHRRRNVNCLAVAKSHNLAGPYFLVSTDAPLYCPDDIIGVIAPSHYQNGPNEHFLLFSMFQGTRGRAAKGIYIIRLSPDGLTTIGNPVKLLGVDQSWEKGHIEGPSLVRRDNTYYLFYTGSTYNDKSGSYAIGYASSDSLFGPYVKSPYNPLIASQHGYFNPGSQGIFHDQCGNYLLSFHAYPNEEMIGKRNSYLTRLIFAENRLLIDSRFDYNYYTCNPKFNSPD